MPMLQKQDIRKFWLVLQLNSHFINHLHCLTTTKLKTATKCMSYLNIYTLKLYLQQYLGSFASMDVLTSIGLELFDKNVTLQISFSLELL